MTKHRILLREYRVLPTKKGMNLLKQAVIVTKIDIKQKDFFLYPITDFIEREIPAAKDRMNLRLNETQEIINAINYMKDIGEL